MAAKIFLAVAALFLAWIVELYYFQLGISAYFITLFIGLCLIYWATAKNNNSSGSTDLPNNAIPSKKGSLGNLFFGFVSGGFWGGLVGFALIKLYFASIPPGEYATLEGLQIAFLYIFSIIAGIVIGSVIGFAFGAKIRDKSASKISSVRIIFGVFASLAVVVILSYLILLRLAGN